MDIRTYQVNCDQCGAERQVRLAKAPLGTQIDWMEDGTDHQIVSFRERLDGEFGWQCLCGNNDLMTIQERKSISNPAVPKAKEIDEIVKSLKVQKPKFSLREV